MTAVSEKTLSSENEISKKQWIIEKTADGRPLLLERTGGPLPLRADDFADYFQAAIPEFVLWLLTAAGSGIVGNVAYDSVKELVKRARSKHKKFLISLSKDKEVNEQARKSASGPAAIRPRPPVRMKPSLNLREDLVELAYDALDVYRQLRPSPVGGISEISPVERISEINVFLTRNMTWAVAMRELGELESITVEIDLTKGMKRGSHRNVGEIDGFPVTIWPALEDRGEWGDEWDEYGD